MMPSILSQFVSTIKETTLGYVINVPELTFAASQLNNRLLTKPFEIFAILAIVYFIVCWSLSELANQLEQRIARQRLGDDQSGTGMLPPDAPKLQGAT